MSGCSASFFHGKHEELERDVPQHLGQERFERCACFPLPLCVLEAHVGTGSAQARAAFAPTLPPTGALSSKELECIDEVVGIICGHNARKRSAVDYGRYVAADDKPQPLHECWVVRAQLCHEAVQVVDSLCARSGVWRQSHTSIHACSERVADCSDQFFFIIFRHYIGWGSPEFFFSFSNLVTKKKTQEDGNAASDAFQGPGEAHGHRAQPEHQREEARVYHHQEAPPAAR